MPRHKEQAPDPVVSRIEAARFLAISLSTLDRSGLPKVRRGRRGVGYLMSILKLAATRNAAVLC